MKSVFSKKSLPDPELLLLKAELRSAQSELACAYRQFNQAVEPELVESCVYQISAVKARCNYLIRAIKERTSDVDAAPVRATGSKHQKHLKKTERRRAAATMLPAMGAVEYDDCNADGEGAVWT